MAKNLLITGPPGIGKTTVIRSLFDLLKTKHPNVKVIGFYTAEIRKNSIRTGRAC